jgi:CHAD domain-containing protein
MMAEGKWIEGLSPDMHVADAARKVLPARLAVVAQHLPLAANSAANDVEHVHQLRVATRRASAALRLFSDCLTAKRSRNVKELLRKLRRSAGAARDWDVFFLHLQSTSMLQSVAARPFLDFLTGIVAAHRMEAQEQLVAAASNESKRLETEIDELESEAGIENGVSKHATIGDLAIRCIVELVGELSSLAASTPSSYEDLHQLRILGKRLRYSMEIFADCFAPEFRELLYPAIEEMQEILGRITDAHVAAERIVEMRDHMKAFHPTQWVRFRKSAEQFLQTQRRIFPRERKRFLTWWPRWKRLSEQYPVASLL